MKSKKKRISMSLLLCCIVLAAVLWLLGPRVANHFGWIWQDTLPDHVAYSGRIYAPVDLGRCLTQDEAKQSLLSKGDGLIQAGSIPAIFGVSAPLFVESSNGSNPLYSVAVKVYIMRKAECYVPYELEGGA